VTDTVAQNSRIAEALKLPFPVLSDPDAVVIRQFGVYVDERAPGVEGTKAEPGIAKPAVFVIRSDFTIAFQYVARDQMVWADRPLDEEILSAVRDN
jgi:peroxiredoxin